MPSRLNSITIAPDSEEAKTFLFSNDQNIFFINHDTEKLPDLIALLQIVKTHSRSDKFGSINEENAFVYDSLQLKDAPFPDLNIAFEFVQSGENRLLKKYCSENSVALGQNSKFSVRLAIKNNRLSLNRLSINETVIFKAGSTTDYMTISEAAKYTPKEPNSAKDLIIFTKELMGSIITLPFCSLHELSTDLNLSGWNRENKAAFTKFLILFKDEISSILDKATIDSIELEIFLDACGKEQNPSDNETTTIKHSSLSIIAPILAISLARAQRNPAALIVPGFDDIFKPNIQISILEKIQKNGIPVIISSKTAPTIAFALKGTNRIFKVAHKA